MKCLKCFAGGIDCDGAFQGAFQYFGARLEFQDAELNTHIHSENYRIDKYECANGHAWEVKSYRHCGAPKCEWDKEQSRQASCRVSRLIRSEMQRGFLEMTNHAGDRKKAKALAPMTPTMQRLWMLKRVLGTIYAVLAMWVVTGAALGFWLRPLINGDTFSMMVGVFLLFALPALSVGVRTQPA